MALPSPRESQRPPEIRQLAELATDIINQAGSVSILDSPLFELVEKYPECVRELVKGRHKAGADGAVAAAFTKTLKGLTELSFHLEQRRRNGMGVSAIESSRSPQ